MLIDYHTPHIIDYLYPLERKKYKKKNIRMSHPSEKSQG